MIQQSQNYLNFSGRPLANLQEDYPKFEWNPNKDFTTLLHPKIVVIRSLAVLAMMGLAQLVFRSSVIRKPLLIIGIVMIAKIIFSNCFKDSLVELFKGEYPRIKINQAYNESICDAINRLKWDDLSEPFYQGETRDGRKVFIARGISTKNEFPITVQTTPSMYIRDPSVNIVNPSVHRLHVYIEGFNTTDALKSSYVSTAYHDRKSSARDNVMFYQPESYSVSFSNAFPDMCQQDVISCETECRGTISAAEAFEILAQLDQR